MPKPKKGEKKEDYISRCVKHVMNKEGKSQDQAVAMCHSYWEQAKEGKEMSKKLCLRGLKTKEEDNEYVVSGLVATTHPDREKDILSKDCLEQIAHYINDVDSVGDGTGPGSYRSVSLYHDWIRESDPSKDEVGFAIPGSAEVVELDDGNYGVKADVKLNKYYKGDVDIDEVKYRIDNGSIGGFSIEYNTDADHSVDVEYNGDQYRIINGFTEYGGFGLARARKIANPKAVIYKEIEQKIKEKVTAMEKKRKSKGMSVSEFYAIPRDPPSKSKLPIFDKAHVKNAMARFNQIKGVSKEEKKKARNKIIRKAKKFGIDIENFKKNKELKEVKQKMADGENEEKKPEEEDKQPEKKEKEEKPEEKEQPEEKESKEVKKFSVKDTLESKEFKEAVENEVEVKMKSMKEDREKKNSGMSLAVKEMDKALKEGKILEFNEARRMYFKENSDIPKKLRTTGIPLETTLNVKCDGTKLKIVGGLQTKDVLDTSTNTTSYTESPVEFADVFMPGIIDTFNNQTNLFGRLPKKDHIEGGYYYGWRITTSQSSSLAVDPDSTNVDKEPVNKLKLRTDIKEYRIGVSVSDYTLHHSRAAIGDLFQIEVDKKMKDLMKDINGDLFTEQVPADGNKILGLEAVADSAGNTSIYGISRSSSNRLAPDSAGDTYDSVSGSLTTALLRKAIRKVEEEGADRGNLRIVTNPTRRDDLLELMDDNQRFSGVKANFGFDPSAIRYDGIPIIVDSDCTTDSLFVVDFESEYIVISRPPQLVGLAKVGAAKEAYVSTYLAHVYEQPRRIYMLNDLT